MSDMTSSVSKGRSVLSYLSLSAVMAAALLCMGSGFGNSGCERDEPSCSEACAIEGTYELTFDDPSAFSAECEAIGLSLPSEPLVLSRNNAQITAKLAGIELFGYYFGGDDTSLVLGGNKFVDDPDTTGFTIATSLEGSFSQAPKSGGEPLTFKGKYITSQAGSFTIGASCDVERSFTASR